MLWRQEPPFTRDEANDLIRFLMKMDAKLEHIRELLESDDAEEED